MFFSKFNINHTYKIKSFFSKSMESPSLRLASHAGSWYNDNRKYIFSLKATKLDAELKEYFARASSPLNIASLKGIIGP